MTGLYLREGLPLLYWGFVDKPLPGRGHFGLLIAAFWFLNSWNISLNPNESYFYVEPRPSIFYLDIYSKYIRKSNLMFETTLRYFHAIVFMAKGLQTEQSHGWGTGNGKSGVTHFILEYWSIITNMLYHYILLI